MADDDQRDYLGGVLRADEGDVTVAPEPEEPETLEEELTRLSYSGPYGTGSFNDFMTQWPTFYRIQKYADIAMAIENDPTMVSQRERELLAYGVHFDNMARNMLNRSTEDQWFSFGGWFHSGILPFGLGGSSDIRSDQAEEIRNYWAANPPLMEAYAHDLDPEYLAEVFEDIGGEDFLVDHLRNPQNLGGGIIETIPRIEGGYDIDDASLLGRVAGEAGKSGMAFITANLAGRSGGWLSRAMFGGETSLAALGMPNMSARVGARGFGRLVAGTLGPTSIPSGQSLAASQAAMQAGRMSGIASRYWAVTRPIYRKARLGVGIALAGFAAPSAFQSIMSEISSVEPAEIAALEKNYLAAQAALNEASERGVIPGSPSLEQAMGVVASAQQELDNLTRVTPEQYPPEGWKLYEDPATRPMTGQNAAGTSAQEAVDLYTRGDEEAAREVAASVTGGVTSGSSGSAAPGQDTAYDEYTDRPPIQTVPLDRSAMSPPGTLVPEVDPLIEVPRGWRITDKPVTEGDRGGVVPGMGEFRLPKYRVSDVNKLMLSMPPAAQEALIARLVAAGMITADEARRASGVTNYEVYNAFTEVLAASNWSGADWNDTLDKLVLAEKERKKEARDANRVPFGRFTYLPPDYDELVDSARALFESKVGRKPTDSELTLYAEELGRLSKESARAEHRFARYEYRADKYDARAARQEQKDQPQRVNAEGRPTGTAFPSTMPEAPQMPEGLEAVNPTASVSEMIGERYGPEITAREQMDGQATNFSRMMSAIGSTTRRVTGGP